jgi:hypothetical protein
MHRDDALMDIAERHHRLIVRSDVSAVGLSSDQWGRRLERGIWRTMAPGVWCHRATPDTWRLRARAGAVWLGADAALYGRSAAAWWGIDALPPQSVEFVVPRGRRSVDGPFVVHTTTEWCAADLLRHDGLRVTTAIRTVIDMAGSEPSASAIERVIDEAIRQRLLTLPRLIRRAGELGQGGRRGTAVLRSLLLDSGGESYLERRFLGLVRRAGLPRPACQVVDRSDGRLIARVDFLFRGTNVVVEVSGRLGHVSDRDRQRDARRRNELQLAGRIVLEFTTADVLDQMDYVIDTLRSRLHG